MLRRTCIACLAWIAMGANAFLLSPPEVTVVEYRNVVLGHYFLTADQDEARIIDSGGAGAGWYRTGRAFTAFAYSNPPWCYGCVPVARFYGTPGLGPNSHFYTENPDEASLLRMAGSGWTLERPAAFASALPDRATGQCPAQAPVPVTRLYNGRWMFNDSNHRYVTRASDRAEMVAAGWADEGVHFCALGEVEVPYKTFSIEVASVDDILPSAECEDDSRRTGSCLAVNNMPVPRTPIDLSAYPTAARQRFVDLTGISSDTAYVPWLGSAADGPFVEIDGPVFGIHLDTLGKGPTQSSSFNPLYQFPTRDEDGDARYFPWRSDGPYEKQLSIASNVRVMKALARNAQSNFQGHPTLEFIDTTSGHHLYFTVSVYAQKPDDGSDYLAPDIGTGKVIVGTTHRASTPYGRSLGSDSLYVPSGFQASIFSSGPDAPKAGSFDFRMDRVEFGRVLASARRIDAALSGNPDDYLLDNFHFNNEIGGDGEVGLSVALSLRVLRR